MKTAMAALTGAVMFLAAVLVAEWQGDVPAPGSIGIQTLGPPISGAPGTTSEGTTSTNPPVSTGVVGTLTPAALHLPPIVEPQIVSEPVIGSAPQPKELTDLHLKQTKRGTNRGNGKGVKEDGPGGTQGPHQNDRPKGFKLSKHNQSKHGKGEHGKKNGQAEDGVPQTEKGHAGRGAACGHVRAHRRGHAYGRGRSGVRPHKKAARC